MLLGVGSRHGDGVGSTAADGHRGLVDGAGEVGGYIGLGDGICAIFQLVDGDVGAGNHFNAGAGEAVGAGDVEGILAAAVGAVEVFAGQSLAQDQLAVLLGVGGRHGDGVGGAAADGHRGLVDGTGKVGGHIGLGDGVCAIFQLVDGDVGTGNHFNAGAGEAVGAGDVKGILAAAVGAVEIFASQCLAQDQLAVQLGVGGGYRDRQTGGIHDDRGTFAGEFRVQGVAHGGTGFHDAIGIPGQVAKGQLVAV